MNIVMFCLFSYAVVLAQWMACCASSFVGRWARLILGHLCLNVIQRFGLLDQMNYMM
jgi:hypothetical protein